ncbi:MAG TPA: shikimate kinase [Burkholderiales bacterium]|nr:shikimate kinase [Burkholderiales bacterium]
MNFQTIVERPKNDSTVADLCGGISTGYASPAGRIREKRCNPRTPMRKLEKTVVLVGMMGAGKTSVGRRLAAVLAVPFRDADSEIEQAAACTVNEIFERYGEPEFRAGERKVILRLLQEPPHVLATGGGAFMDPETRAKIKESAISIWLKAHIELLLDRVMRKDTRPLLRNTDRRAALERLLKEREPIYAEADITVESEGGPHEMMVKRVLAALDAHGCEQRANLGAHP